MLRHFVVTFVLATLASLTVLALAAAGILSPLGAWLFDRYLAEGLVKEGAARIEWLVYLAVVITSFAVGWLAVESGPAGPKLAIAGVAALLWGFLSLTLTLYGIFFDPFEPMAAAVLAGLTGLCVAETPRGRHARDMTTWLDGRVSAKTLRELLGSDWRPDSAPCSRELAVVVCRVLDFPSGTEPAHEYLEAARALTDEVADFFRHRPGVVLDLPEADSVRAIFGVVPERAATAVSDACGTALELKRCLREFADLNKQAARPPVNYGIGISAGPMLLGLFSGRFKPVATATGAPADHARHLAALTTRHHATILLGRRAAHLAREQFDLRALDGEALHALVGRREPVADEPIAIDEPEPREEVPSQLPDAPAAPFRPGGGKLAPASAAPSQPADDRPAPAPTAPSQPADDKPAPAPAALTTNPSTATETSVDEIVVPQTSIDPFPPVHSSEHPAGPHKPRVIHKKRPKPEESTDKKAG